MDVVSRSDKFIEFADDLIISKEHVYEIYKKLPQEEKDKFFSLQIQDIDKKTATTWHDRLGKRRKGIKEKVEEESVAVARTGKWFIKGKKSEKTKRKDKNKSESCSSREDNNSLESKESNNLDLLMSFNESPTPKIDDEGYIIRPKSSSVRTKTIDNFYSSSDSDSEEEKEQKIRIQIKPLTNGAPRCASVDELIASVGTLSLYPVTQNTVSKPLSTAIPRPPSKKNLSQNSHQNSMSRCESLSSLSSDFRMTSISVGSSRGPSPLTLGISDVVPIAVALQESVNACFKGQDETLCQVNLVGSLKLAFPSGIIQVLANNPYPAPLNFKLSNSSNIEKIYPNKELFSDYRIYESKINSLDDHLFEINMPALLSNIRYLYKQTPNARYFNIEVLKYQIRFLQGVKNAPFQIITHWKCEPNSTSLKIDYKYNSSSLSKIEPLKNVIVNATVDGGVVSMQSNPEGVWNSLTNQVSWRLDQISMNSQNSGIGSIKARFDLSSGPSNPSVIQINFNAIDTTVSGIDFDLASSGYRISLVKKQISSGRYICE